MGGQYGLRLEGRGDVREYELSRHLDDALDACGVRAHLWPVDVSGERARSLVGREETFLLDHMRWAQRESDAPSIQGRQGRWGLTFLLERMITPCGLDEARRIVLERYPGVERSGQWPEVCALLERTYLDAPSSLARVEHVEVLTLCIGSDVLCPGNKVQGMSALRYRSGDMQFIAREGSAQWFGAPFFSGLAPEFGHVADPGEHVRRLVLAYASALGTTAESVVPTLDALRKASVGSYARAN